jgi:hypothetical protein
MVAQAALACDPKEREATYLGCLRCEAMTSVLHEERPVSFVIG